jgi:O-antigen/teichoic acid export membrane protein
LLRTNILANLIGSGWIALLTLIATPIQIHLLGVEAYGLVGLVAILQVVFSTLDLGLSASVTQTIAADRSAGREESAALTNSVRTLYTGMAVVIGLLLWIAAGWIATRWLKPHSLTSETVLVAVRTIGIYVAIRWPIAFYSGVLAGIQRMDLLNLLKGGAATLRIVGGIVVILIDRSIVAFLAWFAIAAVVELAAFAIATHRLVPALRYRPQFSTEALRSVWRFSLTMAGIAVLAMLLTQLDRLVVSKLLTLRELGFYSLAYTTGIGISLLQTSINSAAMPAFSEAAASGGTEALRRRYAKTSELTAYAVALPCFVLVFFGADILRVWVGDEAARAAGLPLALLSVGFFINGIVSNAYIAAVATRNAGIPAIVNLVAVLLYVPALYGLTRGYGMAGAAAGWMALNACYLPSLLVLVHRRVLHQPVTPWLARNLALPVLAALLSFGLFRAGALLIAGQVAIWAALALALIAYAACTIALMGAALRNELLNFGPLAVLLPIRRAAQ